jgi:hypothetical protein
VNDETKLALALVALIAVGLALIALGAGVFTKLAATICGLAFVWSGTLILAALLRR